MEKLSIVIITHNEADNIKDCLETVMWADEIVVLDSFSEDETVQLCRQYTDKIFQSKFTDFSLQKNMVLGRASNEWVLSLDADERVTSQLKARIVSIISEDSEEYAGYYVPRENYFFGKWIKHCGLYPDYVLRLFRRSKGRFQDKLVHESVILEGNAGYLGEPLEHYTYKSIDDFIKRMEHYAALSVKQMRKEKKKSRWYNLMINPLAIFLKMYFLKKGFLDRSPGFIVCVLYTYYVFLKYAKSWEARKLNVHVR